MYVCVCRAVTHVRVNAVIDAGAQTVDAVTAACGAGSDCGACREKIGEMVAERALVPAAALVRERAA